jgi:TPR repeat protein
MHFNALSILFAATALLSMSATRANAAEDPVHRASQFIVEGSRVEAETLLRSSAASGDLSAAAMLGSLLSQAAKYSEAIQVLEPAATKGNAEAQWHLSQAYALTSPPDFERSNFWLRRAADAGSSKAKTLLQDQTDLRPGQDGRVSTRALAESIRSLIAAKASSFDERTLRCYGASRPKLLAALNASLGRCFQALPVDQRDRVVPSQAFMQSLVSCANGGLFERVGKSPAELVACLPSK